jgi:hypothetical protein
LEASFGMIGVVRLLQDTYIGMSIR